MEKKCSKCNGYEFYASGKCKACHRARVSRGAKRKTGKEAPPISEEIGRPPRKVESQIDFNISGDTTLEDTEQDFLKSIKNATKRLEFMMRRHRNTLANFDAELQILNKLLSEDLAISDVKNFLNLRHKLLAERADYDLEMSKQLQVFEEFAAKEQKETPITFVIEKIPVPEGIVIPAVIEQLDLSPYYNEPE